MDFDPVCKHSFPKTNVFQNHNRRDIFSYDWCSRALKGERFWTINEDHEKPTNAETGRANGRVKRDDKGAVIIIDSGSR